MEGYLQGAQWKELRIAPFALKQRFEKIFVDFLLVEGHVQGALRKELRIVPFVESFKAVTLESLTNKFCQYMEEFVKALHFCWPFAAGKLYTGHSTKRAAYCYFRRAL